MFCDITRLILHAGNGGNGCIGFRREKFVAKGGPNGGDGGKGGSIFFRVNPALNTLTHLDTYKQFQAEKGEMGKGQNKHGKNGDDLELEVPQGTIVREIIRNTNGDIINKKLLSDLSGKNMRLLVLRGGRGGYGNAHFVSSIRQAPKFAELGEEGESIEVELELKLIADIGIIGIPSSGKSTLISAISNAKPNIAEYHFTTLKPHLGVVKIDEKVTYIVADIPGLIEKAHKGKGLGIKFLKHIQRCKLLIHLIDPIQPDLSHRATKTKGPLNNFHLINNELKAFSEDLAKKKQILIINKNDIIDEKSEKKIRAELKKTIRNQKNFRLYKTPISAATRQGTEELKIFLFQEIQRTIRESKKNQKQKITKQQQIYRPHEKNPKYFSVEKIKNGEYLVKGRRIEQIVNMTDFSNQEASMRVCDVLKKMGIEKELKKTGALTGDTLHIGKQVFDFEPEF